MVFQELRNKLLQKAITGQLVPQLDSEPAVEQLGPAPKPEEVPLLVFVTRWLLQNHVVGERLKRSTPILLMAM